MKKTFFALLFIVAGLNLSAQIRKGQWLAGGNVNWTSSFNTYTTDRSTLITIMPDAGYFFIDKLAGGMKLNFVINNPSNDYHNWLYGFSPFVRYYILPPSKTINIFAEAAYGWNRDDIQGFHSTSHEWSVSAGPAFFFNPHVALEVALMYTNTSGQVFTSGNAETFGMNIGFQVYLGK
jgi:hypothetical protein